MTNARTVLLQTFKMEMVKRNPDSMRYLEARLLTRQDSEWAGYSYRWNEDHTDAELVKLEGLNTTL